MRATPPPLPERARRLRRGSQTTPERLSSLAREERQRERAFDPEAPREHYARAHHFAINDRPKCVHCRKAIQDSESFVVLGRQVRHQSCGRRRRAAGCEDCGAQGGEPGTVCEVCHRGMVRKLHRNPELSFEDWLKAVDELVASKLDGLGIDDLRDMNTWDAWNAGTSPRQFVNEDVRQQVEQDFGQETADELFGMRRNGKLVGFAE